MLDAWSLLLFKLCTDIYIGLFILWCRRYTQTWNMYNIMIYLDCLSLKATSYYSIINTQLTIKLKILNYSFTICILVQSFIHFNPLYINKLNIERKLTENICINFMQIFGANLWWILMLFYLITEKIFVNSKNEYTHEKVW